MLLNRCSLRGAARITQGRRWLATAMVLGLAASFGQRIHAQDLATYANDCKKAIGVAVPAFDCSKGIEVPVTNLKDGKCDRPDRMRHQCDKGNRFQVLARTPYIVALCRTGGQTSGYDDIAVIQYNPANGATCFYQKIGSYLSGAVAAPSDGKDADNAFDPPDRGRGCVDCHDNGPFIRSPFLTQISDAKHKLPNLKNKSDEPYAFVGAEFAKWKAYSVEVKNNKCIGCHRLGVAKRDTTVPSDEFGTARHFSVQATAESEKSKNPTSSASPLWMPTDGVTFDHKNAAAALAIKNCAEHIKDKQMPDTDKCRIKLFAKAYQD